jgi:hypothetical protein
MFIMTAAKKNEVEASRPQAMVEVTLRSHPDAIANGAGPWEGEKVRVSVEEADRLIGAGHCLPRMLVAQSPQPDGLDGGVEIVLGVNGVVIDGLARRIGERVRVTTEERERLLTAGYCRPAPLVRLKVGNRLVGSRVAQAGDTVEAPSLAAARHMHAAGVADFVNAQELGERLPARNSDEAIGPSSRRVRALCDFVLGALIGAGFGVARGSEFYVSEDEALSLMGRVLVEPVGWSPEKHPMVRFQVVRPCSVGGRSLAKGEIAQSDDAAFLMAAMVARDIGPVEDTWAGGGASSKRSKSG